MPNTLHLVLQRRPTHADATIGELLQDGLHLCYTLEDTVRERLGVPVAEWKVKGATAIPSGTYRIGLEYSPKYGPDTLTIEDVPGYQYIRMHAGNTAADTEGCILLGLRASDTALIGGTSRPAVALVNQVVRTAIDNGRSVTIEIRNAAAEPVTA